jgi:hypothetical protein
VEPGLGEQQQREQSGRLGLVGHQRGEHARQPDRLGAKPGAGGCPGGVGARVVDQVDHREHGPQPVRQLVVARHPVRDPGELDLSLGPDQALGHGRFGDQEGAGHLVGAEPAEQPQGQRDLGFGGQRRMATGEDQPKTVVRHRSHLPLPRSIRLLEHREILEQLAASDVAAQPVDRAPPRRRGDPAARVGWQAVPRPAAKRHRERVLHGVLGDLDLPEEPDQGGHGPAGLLAEDPADRGLPDGAGALAHEPVHPVRIGCPRTDEPRSASR